MSITLRRFLLLGVIFPVLSQAGCRKSEPNPAAEAPPTTPQVLASGVDGSAQVNSPAQFPLVTAAVRTTYNSLNVTGAVQPDPSREVPVLSIANGRVVALHVGLGDMVHKGQLVMEVQSPDVTGAFASYLKAVNDEQLTRTVLVRDKLLYSKGAIAQSQLEVAQNGEDDAQADLRAAEQQLTILGVDKNHPGDTVKVYAPISGIIVAQNTTTAGAAGLNVAGVGGSLTVADLSRVWVVCDVYENDLASVHLGESADIRINAFPARDWQGTISDIGAVLDPNLRTAKVRIVVPNPNGLLRIGMFATATFRGDAARMSVVVPEDAVLHLHDRAYVYLPGNNPGNFLRHEVHTGEALDGNLLVITQGLSAGQQVVSNALQLENAAGQ